MLIAGTLRCAVTNEVARAAAQSKVVRRDLPRQLNDAAAALRNVHDDRAIQDWTIDILVDRLLEQLTW
jgi:hypothetical protein